MLKDPKVFIIAEDVEMYRKWCAGLFKEFGGGRVVNAPVAEFGFVGLATGAGMLGMRAITEFVMIDWITVAMGMIVNQAAKAHFMSGGQYQALSSGQIGPHGPAQMSRRSTPGSFRCRA